MKAAVLAIGDELVTGRTPDTNSAYLAQALRGAGIDVVGFLTVADDEVAIVRAFDRALEDATLVVSTGGLGPTSDDLTTACVARSAGVPLVLDKPSLRAIEERMHGRGLEMPANNRKQALFPRGSVVLPNADGTAPGFLLELDRPDGTRFVACLPGVPREMRRIAEESLLPSLVQRAAGLHLVSRVFSTVGLSESKLDELLGNVDLGGARISYRAAFPRLQVRVSVADSSPAAAERRLDQLEREARERLGDHLYAVGDVGLEEAVGRMLADRGLTLAVAESCTGGLLGHRVTEVPGSSAYFAGGVVAYSNELKRDLLGVAAETLGSFGAVSERVVLEMARGARRVANADIGLATSGIAGPAGGTPDKPVGTVCIGLAWEGGESARTYAFGPRSRSWIKAVTAQTALEQLRRMLKTSV